MARDGLLGPVAGAGDDPFGWIPVTVSPASGGERSSDAGALADRIAIRPVPLTRKNALFAGNDDGAKTWARCASLLGTCKLNGVNPQTYLTVTLRRIVDMHPMGVDRRRMLTPHSHTISIY